MIKGNEKNFLILFAYMPLAIQNQFISRIDSSLIESIVL